MKIRKTGKYFVAISLTKSIDLIIEWHPSDWRYMFWFTPPVRPWKRRIWLGPLEIEFDWLRGTTQQT